MQQLVYQIPVEKSNREIGKIPSRGQSPLTDMGPFHGAKQPLFEAFVFLSMARSQLRSTGGW